MRRPVGPDLLGQVVHRDLLVLRERDRALHRILELPHVARPGVRQEPLGRRGGEARHTLPCLLGEVDQEVLGEEEDVVPAGPERGRLHGDHIDAEVEVLAEKPFLDGGFEVTVRRRHEADVERDLLTSPDRTDGALLEGAEQLGLEREGQVADLVEQQRAPVRLHEEARPRRARVGEGAPDVAEELALEELLGHGGAVDRHQRSVLPIPAPVERLGDDLLPGAALAGDEDARVGVGDPVEQLVELPHGRAVADELLEALRLADQPP